MTDYVKGLLNARQDYLNTKFPEKITEAHQLCLGKPKNILQG